MIKQKHEQVRVQIIFIPCRHVFFRDNDLGSADGVWVARVCIEQRVQVKCLDRIFDVEEVFLSQKSQILRFFRISDAMP